MSVPQLTQHSQIVHLPADVPLEGFLTCPADARGIVIFAHASGSSRFSQRNRAAATTLVRNGYASLLLDLLTAREAEQTRLVMDVAALATRLETVTEWVMLRSSLAHLPIAYCGASTGTAAALMAAANLGRAVSAIVSRGGRPDLAGDALARVTTPTLLLVGGNDHDLMKLNAAALARMDCTRQLVVVPGAGPLFREEGAMERVARFSTAWLNRYVGATAFAM